MGTTNILDLNNRVDEMEKSYPAEQVMMSDGVTSVEEAVNDIVGGTATDFQAWGNNNGEVVFSVFIPCFNKRIGIRRAPDGTISSYVE